MLAPSVRGEVQFDREGNEVASDSKALELARQPSDKLQLGAASEMRAVRAAASEISRMKP